MTQRTKLTLRQGTADQTILVITGPGEYEIAVPLIAGNDPVGLKEDLVGLAYGYQTFNNTSLRAAAATTLWDVVDQAAADLIAELTAAGNSRGFYDEITGQPLSPRDITEVTFDFWEADNGWFPSTDGQFTTAPGTSGVFDYYERATGNTPSASLEVPDIADGDFAEDVLICSGRTELTSEPAGKLVLTRPALGATRKD